MFPFSTAKGVTGAGIAAVFAGSCSTATWGQENVGHLFWASSADVEAFTSFLDRWGLD